MKGDWSRFSFDPRKHYRSVYMQQGRVQLDADWNEQQNILLHLITTQMNDLLGSGGATAGNGGFAILPLEHVAVQPGDSLPSEPRPGDFQIGAGHYYVDGILCENESPVLFSQQPDYPAAASVLEAIDSEHALAYLDVWQRHITAVQDPAIREVALGGADTTTRIQTVWQVKLLPLPGDPAEEDLGRQGGGLYALAEWQAFMARAANKGRLWAMWQDTGTALENHLYRVEIHRIDGGQVTFKWSRENGSVILPIVPGAEPPTARAQGNDWATLELVVEDLGRDQFELQTDHWVEIVDDVTVLDGRSLPLCEVKELDRLSGRVTLQAKQESMDRILAEIGHRELRHPLLRRWEDQARAIAIEDKPWHHLENGIGVSFDEQGAYQAGDYWLIPARTRWSGGIEWPQQEGQPLAQVPHGVLHHYAPLDMLHFQDKQWQATRDATPAFHSLPQITSRVHTAEAQLERANRTLAALEHQVSRIQTYLAVGGTGFFQDLVSDEPLEIGHVVSFVPGSASPSDPPEDSAPPDCITLATQENRRLVIGVVTGPVANQERRYRVALYGRARCRVVGSVRPGDLLVPSDEPGHAQRGGLYLQPGTVIGKALTSVLDENGQRTVELLVTLG